MCSDAFFPFPDGLVAAADAGATAAIQPGGSVRDAEVIAAADARDVAMVFTGVRHFRHERAAPHTGEACGRGCFVSTTMPRAPDASRNRKSHRWGDRGIPDGPRVRFPARETRAQQGESAIRFIKAGICRAAWATRARGYSVDADTVLVQIGSASGLGRGFLRARISGEL